MRRPLSTESSVETFAREKLAALERAEQLRLPVTTMRLDGAWVERQGRRLLSFCSNDYFDLTRHPAVVEAARSALERYGSGAGAAYAVSGNHPLYAALEVTLAAHKRSAAACVFGSGYLANLGTIPALVGGEDLVLLDERAHACLWAGAQLSGAQVVAFRHNDPEHARELLRSERGRRRFALVATETVFSMDGDRAPVAALAELAADWNAWLLTDDAHGLGFVEPNPDVPLQIGTLSKGLASIGGYLCASEAVVALSRNRARTFVYTTALPPASVAAASAALRVLGADPERVAAPLRQARRFTARLGLAPAESAIVPFVLGGERAALAAAEALAEAGFLVVAIRPPTVPAGSARLRFAFSAAHTDAAVDELADALARAVG